MANISGADLTGQYRRSWHAGLTGISVGHMADDTSKKAKPTLADVAAAGRLKGIWESRAKELGITQDKAAAYMDISQGAISQYLNGIIPLNYRALLAFSHLLGVDPERIRDDLPEQRHQHGVREPGAAAVDLVEVRIHSARLSGGDGADNDTASVIGTLLFRPKSLARKGVDHEFAGACYVDGDSMIPRLRNGDTVLFDTRDTKPKDGRIYAIRWNGADFVKRLRYYDGRWWISSDNKAEPQWRDDKPISPDREEFVIRGRVRWIGSWED